MAEKRFNLSVNIKTGWGDDWQYIATPNAVKAMQSLINGFHAGIHSYTIIGPYGTGKSSFLYALQSDMTSGADANKYILKDSTVFNGKETDFEIIKVVGDYEELSLLMARELGVTEGQENIIDALRGKYKQCRTKGKFMVIIIDEFGKILEHAAEKNPGSELYFLQKLAEFVNVPSKNILLITTLHQNFSTYGNKLTEAQKNEWTKVKGRFQEIVFVEPVEQIMFLASQQRDSQRVSNIIDDEIVRLQQLAKKTRFISDSYTVEASKHLSPLDPFSAFVITSAIQRYGQNERSLFSFLSAKGKKSLNDFEPRERYTYNLSEVYDYIVDNFYSYLQTSNPDSMTWSGIRTAIERVAGARWNDNQEFCNAVNIVKCIGVMNLFGTASYRSNVDDMAEYAALAMDDEKAKEEIDKLIQYKIVRYAEYKQRLILFEGTDVNIEDELRKASLVVPRPAVYIDDLRMFINKRISLVKAYYYHRGTPRYFKYLVLSSPEDINPTGDTDGYVQLIFPSGSNAIEEVSEFSSQSDNAIIYVVFNNAAQIITHIHNLNKYDYILEKVLIDKMDYVAIREVTNLKEYEMELLNKVIFHGLYSYGGDTCWIYKGKKKEVRSQSDFNKLLSEVCDDVYGMTPIINNELINRHSLSSNISGVRAKYIEALLEHSDEEDLGFDADKFPPEKTIYYTLLKNTGLHVNGEFKPSPNNADIDTLWEACEDFLSSTKTKARKISELQHLLLVRPYKLKKGLLDFWIPTYLYVKRQDYSLYETTTGAYIPNVSREFFDLLQKNPDGFMVKAFNVSGIEVAFYNQYRKYINIGRESTIKNDGFIETVKPFFAFYRRLNDYTKHTKKLDSVTTLRFRDVLARAKDPEKTFFVDLPAALGYDCNKLNNEDFVQQYCRLIQKAVRELRSCYSHLIDRIEHRLIDELSLSSDEYSGYIEEIQDRLRSVKIHLLTDKQREFYSHAMTRFDERAEWYQSISYTVLGHTLDCMRDEEEESLEDGLVYLFRTCEKYSRISELTTANGTTAEGFSFDMATTDGKKVRNQTYILPNKDLDKTLQLEERLSELLTGNDNVDICALLRIIKKKISNEG